MSMIARLARRPLHKSEMFDELGITKQVRGLTKTHLKQLVHGGHRVLDRANESIFWRDVTATQDEVTALLAATEASTEGMGIGGRRVRKRSPSAEKPGAAAGRPGQSKGLARESSGKAAGEAVMGWGGRAGGG